MLLAAIAAVTMSTSLGSDPSEAPGRQEARAQRDARMKWWREARFGMFIHWGLYSIPAGKWGDRTDHGEWIMETAKIPVDEYEKLRAQFNPVKFDARAWARMAKEAGMKYMVVTTKHHDGFALFDAKNSDYDVMATPFKRDVMRELSSAVRAEGLQMGWYYSIMDWNHPAYVPARAWNPRQDPARSNLDDYNQYLREQVRQLLSDYGPIGVMWFDGEWESTWNDSYGKPLYELCRRLQPSVIVNNRVSNNRGGSISSDGADQKVGDFSTPEQTIPATGLSGVDWETCMTMNDNWGFNAADRNWKSSRQLIVNLIDVASKGGNYLLNVGPRADGTFPPEAIARLQDIGRWMKVNGESIYGTTASLFEDTPWGRSTTKAGRGRSTIFLHLTNAPANGRVVIPGLASDPVSARVLGGQSVPAVREGSDVVVRVPAGPPNSGMPVVVALQVAGSPVVFRTPRIVPDSEIIVGEGLVRIESSSPKLKIRYTSDGGEPGPDSPLYSGPFAISDTVTVRAAGFDKGRRVTAIAEATVQRVEPWPDLKILKATPGLQVFEYAGDYDRLPDFSKIEPRRGFVSGVIEPAGAEQKREELVARRYQGFIAVPTTGVYKFALTSDDGARLWIDGKLIADGDGLHSSQTFTGVAPLRKGYHAIEVAWFNKTGAAALDLRWSRAGGKLEAISPKALVH